MPRFGQLNLKFTEELDWIRATSGQDLHRVWSAFLRLSACTLASGMFKLMIASDAAARGLRGWSKISLLPSREAEANNEIAKWQPEHLERFKAAFHQMLLEIADNEYKDILGSVHQEWMGKKGQQWGGEFHTPHALSQAMARLTFESKLFNSPEPVRMQEPAVGGGQLVLSMYEVMAQHNIPANRAWFECWDISENAANMCYINLSLHGIPARVVRGNYLSKEIFAEHYTVFHPLACGKPQTEIMPTERYSPLEKKLIQQNVFFQEVV
jgi:hypothetical protein